MKYGLSCTIWHEIVFGGDFFSVFLIFVCITKNIYFLIGASLEKTCMPAAFSFSVLVLNQNIHHHFS